MTALWMSNNPPRHGEVLQHYRMRTGLSGASLAHARVTRWMGATRAFEASWTRSALLLWCPSSVEGITARMRRTVHGRSSLHRWAWRGVAWFKARGLV